MAASPAVVPAPDLWGATRHELFKGRKQRFYVVAVLLPFILALVISVVLGIVKLLTPETGGVPGGGPSGDCDLGPGGMFAFANAVMFSGIGGLYNLVLTLA